MKIVTALCALFVSTSALADPTPLFEVLNDPSAKRPDYWITYKLDLNTNDSNDLVSAHYYGGRENGTIAIEDVIKDGAVLMRTQGVDAIKLLGPQLSAKDGGPVTLSYLKSIFEDPALFEMNLARSGSNWIATETATGKKIRQLRFKTRFCGNLGPCGVESLTVIE
jgi:hypothetical protein